MQHCCKSYTRVLTLGTLAAVAGMITLNWLADPFGVYWGFDGRNQLQTNGLQSSRIVIAERLRQQDFSTVLLGTSRVACGIDPSSPAFADRTVLKVGLSGANFYETFQAFSLAAERTGLEEALLFVDFFQFNANAQTTPGFEQSRLNPDLNPIDYHCEKLLSWRATKNSFRVSTRTLLGQQPPPRTPTSRIKARNRKRTTHAAFEANIKQYVEPRNYGRYQYEVDRTQLFGSLVRTAQERGIRLHVAILPVHAIQLETIRAAGLWDLFEQWKQDLVRIVDQESGTADVPLWDFTGYGTYTCEQVPPPGSPQRMLYYNEASHFTPELGDRVLQRMLNRTDEDADFGTLLTTTNIDKHLQQTRADRKGWLQKNSPSTAWVRGLVQAAGHVPASQMAGKAGVTQHENALR